ncbi:MAG: RNA 2',3'-cyclic phosphodiesterase [Planctomycetes bacterium]|nr:RNA 2',3'-cyclic phosphodiesterase [Planctomycetota bacterium]
MKGDLRCFIAIKIEGAMARRLERENSFLKLSGAQAGWTAERNLHLTLRFIGEVHPEEVIPLGELIEEEAAATPASRLMLKGLHTLPLESARPRIVAVGVEGDLEPIEDLYRRLQKGLRGLGFKPEKQAFHPHVTLARIKGEKNVDRLLEKVASAAGREFGHLQVREIQLMMSDLEIEGPIYTPLQVFPLLG